jgi:galactose mutarotase-like enzyme
LATVRLSDPSAELEATFVPGAGMLCCSLRHRGEELLAQNAGLPAYAARGKTMGIPLLYPWANRLAGFDYTVAGRPVRVPHDDPSLIALDPNGLPIHGVIGGRVVWELLDAPSRDASAGPGAGASDAAKPPSETAPASGERYLKARLSWNDAKPESFDVFPFEHDLLYEARLADGRLEIEVTVHACGADPVPLAFGFHPYLSPGGRREDWLIELPSMRHLELDREQIPLGIEDPASAPRRFALGEREFDDGFDVAGAGSASSPVRFAVTSGTRRLELELLRGYPYAQLYAPLSGRFICFEPMTAPANALRSGEGLRLLAPGERHSAAFSIQIKTLAV